MPKLLTRENPIAVHALNTLSTVSFIILPVCLGLVSLRFSGLDRAGAYDAGGDFTFYSNHLGEQYFYALQIASPYLIIGLTLLLLIGQCTERGVGWRSVSFIKFGAFSGLIIAGYLLALDYPSDSPEWLQDPFLYSGSMFSNGILSVKPYYYFSVCLGAPLVVFLIKKISLLDALCFIVGSVVVAPALNYLFYMTYDYDNSRMIGYTEQGYVMHDFMPLCETNYIDSQHWFLPNEVCWSKAVLGHLPTDNASHGEYIRTESSRYIQARRGSIKPMMDVFNLLFSLADTDHKRAHAFALMEDMLIRADTVINRPQINLHTGIGRTENAISTAKLKYKDEAVNYDGGTDVAMWNLWTAGALNRHLTVLETVRKKDAEGFWDLYINYLDERIEKRYHSSFDINENIFFNPRSDIQVYMLHNQLFPNKQQASLIESQFDKLYPHQSFNRQYYEEGLIQWMKDGEQFNSSNWQNFPFKNDTASKYLHWKGIVELEAKLKTHGLNLNYTCDSESKCQSGPPQ